MVVKLKDALQDSSNVEGIVNSGTTPHLLEDTVWEDLRFPATRLRQGATLKPDFNETEVTIDFDDSSDETTYIIAQLPHAWKQGSEIRPHIHWIQNQNLNIPWSLQYRIQTNGAATTVPWTTITLDQQAYTYTSGDLNQINYSSTNIDMTGCTLSCIIQFKLARDVSEDVYTGDAQVYEFDLHYQIDTLGSQDEFSK